MAQPLKQMVDMGVLDGVPAMLIGAHAAAAYAPARMTAHIYLVVPAEHYAEAQERLRADGWEKINDLVFHASRLGLRGAAWAKPDVDEKGIMTSDQAWLQEAFAHEPVLRKDGMRVIPRDYLILMKLDSARGIDQGDLNRILGLMSREEVEQTAVVVTRHYHDEHILDDLRQSAEIGRWEYASAKKIRKEHDSSN